MAFHYLYDMKNTLTKLFVYGSLRSGFHNPAYDYISKFFTLDGEATVKGKLYDMGGYPAAIPCTDEYYILGELYELKQAEDFSWAIAQLDEYEGVNPGEDELPLYKRDIAEVQIKDEKTNAWIYWFIGNVEGQPVISSGDVKDFIKQKSRL